MKILVGNNGFGDPGGSETYAYALISELVRRGHEVQAVGNTGPGIVSTELGKLGVPVHFKEVTGSFDLLLMSHSSSISKISKCKGFKVQTCHGVFPAVEQPVLGMDVYIAISEEVSQHLASKGYESQIIYNGIDCNRFRPKYRVNDTIKTVLSLGHSDKANEMVEAMCRKLKCGFISKNKYKTPIWKMEELINQADLVVSLGRGAYEAMACGRNVIVFDYRSYMGENPLGDGFVTAKDAPKFIKHNCSGRYSKRTMSVDDLYLESINYKVSTGYKLRQFALKNLNIEKQVDKYLALVR